MFQNNLTICTSICLRLQDPNALTDTHHHHHVQKRGLGMLPDP
jgi:hypothetical protein